MFFEKLPENLLIRGLVFKCHGSHGVLKSLEGNRSGTISGEFFQRFAKQWFEVELAP